MRRMRPRTQRRRGALTWAMTLGLCLALLAAIRPAAAAGLEPAELAVPSDHGVVRAWLFQAPGNAPRPAVLLLHGRQGPAAFWKSYSAQAEHLAAQGMDAWIVSYYDRDDAVIAQSEDREARRKLFSDRLSVWTARVRAVADAALTGKKSNGRVGVLGFSQGGYLAVACAAGDGRVGALAVYYGGVPDALSGRIRRLPPLLAFHGLADTVVPPAKGEALVREAQTLGGQARLVEYPGQGHGFGKAAARDAGERASAFLRKHLLREETVRRPPVRGGLHDAGRESAQRTGDNQS